MNTTSCPGGSSGDGDGPKNLIGRKVAKLRFQLGWTQEILVAKLQIRGCNITRDIIANIEKPRSVATDKHCFFLAKVLGVSIDELFRP